MKQIFILSQRKEFEKMKLIKTKFTLKDYKKFDCENREVYLFEDQDCDELLDSFYTRVIGFIKRKEHFPIIRIADGEFQFLLGKNEFNLRKPIHKLIVHIIRQLLDRVLKPKFVAKARTYSAGVYNHSERSNVKNQYAECLKYISEKGILGIYTVIKPGFYSEQYLPKLFSFFDKENIDVNHKNYIPFYFIYIILTNKRYSSIYKDKHVHLITSFDQERKMKIENTLNSLGVKAVTWTKISRSRSLFDTFNTDDISKSVDIIFVGAGVGKVNIFNQLKNIPAIIIDAGYIFETWQDPKLRNERDYCEAH